MQVRARRVARMLGPSVVRFRASLRGGRLGAEGCLLQTYHFGGWQMARKVLRTSGLRLVCCFGVGVLLRGELELVSVNCWGGRFRRSISWSALPLGYFIRRLHYCLSIGIITYCACQLPSFHHLANSPIFESIVGIQNKAILKCHILVARFIAEEGNVDAYLD
jgi:hypothetical protein